MFCPLDVTTGLIQLVGPISTIDLKNITVNTYPLTISFAPRTTIPTLIGNRIDESTENTCTYKGKRYNLVDVQICSVAHKGFLLPGDSKPPVAELIMTFVPSSQPDDLQSLSGILLCVPIYDSGTPDHAEYLTQLIENTIPSCKYTTIVGSEYVGADYQQIPNSTLSSCVKSCCGDTNCLAYSFQSGTCSLKNAIPEIKNTGDRTQITGTVDHRAPNKGATSSTCAVPVSKGSLTGDKKENTSNVATLESFFYAWSGDTTQTSLAYKTCIETMDKDNQPTSKSLYVVVFPNGTHLTQAGYQQLILQLNGTLLPYTVPPAIRGGDATLKAYEFDEEGRKVATEVSKEGVIYATRLSSCTDDFKHRLEYFTRPPLLPSSAKNGGPSGFNTEQCPYYKTSQYKCVPFNQLTDLSGDYVIPGIKTLETIRYEQQKEKEKTQKTGGRGQGQGVGDADTTKTGVSTTEDMETLFAMGIGGLLAAVVVFRVATWAANHTK